MVRIGPYRNFAHIAVSWVREQLAGAILIENGKQFAHDHNKYFQPYIGENKGRRRVEREERLIQT